MKIFKDSSLLEEIEILDLGMIEVGTEKVFDFYVQNDSEFEVAELQFSVSNPEVSIVIAPEKLQINESAKLVLEWKPTATMKKGLKTPLIISGAEIWK